MSKKFGEFEDSKNATTYTEQHAWEALWERRKKSLECNCVSVD